MGGAGRGQRSNTLYYSVQQKDQKCDRINPTVAEPDRPDRINPTFAKLNLLDWNNPEKNYAARVSSVSPVSHGPGSSPVNGDSVLSSGARDSGVQSECCDPKLKPLQVLTDSSLSPVSTSVRTPALLQYVDGDSRVLRCRVQPLSSVHVTPAPLPVSSGDSVFSSTVTPVHGLRDSSVFQCPRTHSNHGPMSCLSSVRWYLKRPPVSTVTHLSLPQCHGGIPASFSQCPMVSAFLGDSRLSSVHGDPLSFQCDSNPRCRHQSPVSTVTPATPLHSGVLSCPMSPPLTHDSCLLLLHSCLSPVLHSCPPHVSFSSALMSLSSLSSLSPPLLPPLCTHVLSSCLSPLHSCPLLMSPPPSALMSSLILSCCLPLSLISHSLCTHILPLMCFLMSPSSSSALMSSPHVSSSSALPVLMSLTPLHYALLMSSLMSPPL
ncbi:hypothetical protein JOB18_036962 [Solea senegalensis]|uniref:Uncharacterized protein n=1 Tax=Solea senegalensis TaxID=28829 RepID=A0AAV6SH35_SOLSE|nr:hypothetical protein JOB18_036962 [Solea senegalensis]